MCTRMHFGTSPSRQYSQTPQPHEGLSTTRSPTRGRRHAGPDRGDGAGDVPAGDVGERRRLSGHAFAREDVEGIERARVDPDDHLARAGHGVGPARLEREDLGTTVPVDDHGAHGTPQTGPGGVASAARTASPTSAVAPEPPRSGGRTWPAPVIALTAASIRAAAAAASPLPSRSAEPVQHEPGREDGRQGIGDALAGDVGRGSVGGLEEAVMVADVARRRHAEPAHGGGGQVREDVAEHVLGHDHVVVGRALDEIHRHRVDVGVLGLDVGVVGRHLVEQGAEEGVALEHVGLVDERHPPDPVAGRAAPAARQLERLPADPEDAGARDDERVGGDVAADQDARSARRVEALGVLAEDDVVDSLALAEPERAWARPGGAGSAGGPRRGRGRCGA